MLLSRRALFSAAIAAPVGAAGSAGRGRSTPPGVAQACYAIRSRSEAALRDPLAFLEFCRERGAGGVQLSILARDAARLEDENVRKSLADAAAELGL
jgi:hypothetical protein